MSTIRVKKLKENAILPTYGSAGAAGADLYACLDEADLYGLEVMAESIETYKQNFTR